VRRMMDSATAGFKRRTALIQKVNGEQLECSFCECGETYRYKGERS
jgi:hypothetical protein